MDRAFLCRVSLCGSAPSFGLQTDQGGTVCRVRACHPFHLVGGGCNRNGKRTAGGKSPCATVLSCRQRPQHPKSSAIHKLAGRLPHLPNSRITANVERRHNCGHHAQPNAPETLYPLRALGGPDLPRVVAMRRIVSGSGCATLWFCTKRPCRETRT